MANHQRNPRFRVIRSHFPPSALFAVSLSAVLALSVVLALSTMLALSGCSFKQPSSSTSSRPIEEKPLMSELPPFDDKWNYGDPAGTEAHFREVLANHSAASVDFRAQLLSQIARCQGLQRQFDAAHSTLDDVSKLIEQEEGLVIARMRYLLERGRATNSGGNPQGSAVFFEEAFELGKSHRGKDVSNDGARSLDFHLIDAAHMLAIVLPAEQQEPWARNALELARSTSDPRAQGWRGALTNNLGWTYHEQERYDDALQLFEENELFWRDKDRPRNANIARWSQARALRSLQRVEEALQMQTRLLVEWAPEDGGPSGYVYEELGECCLILGREDEARPHFATAYEMLSKDDWLQANEKERLERLAKLGGVEE